MEYVGEHLWAGELGHIFVLSAFGFGLLSSIAYFIAENKQDDSWKSLGRMAFYAHSVSVVAMVGMLFFMIFNQYFEYHYVWQHSSTDLPFRYIFSSFWEGVEGSFMLWMLWHVVIANFLLWRVKDWEAPVFSVIASVQTFLTSMLLGIVILDYKLGSNPFTALLREHPDFMNLPIFQVSEYLTVLDGRGLNPLLQNYWMTIHPPMLFFGFALTLVPFAYAIAGLWRKAYLDWIKPALTWTFFAIGILGTGILMGGAWAYEALSFGGFWAWDPVENSSLVPWLTLVGGGHLMLVQRNKGTSVMSMFLLITLSFCLVQYSSFLTKSGILGDSSVHSFTDLGMTGQLAVSLLFFTFLSVGLVIWRYKGFPKPNQEESIWSREFWMFIGALVLLVSAFQIGFSTSFPVINKIFGTNFAQSAERITYYNQWQLPLAIIVAFTLGFTQFLKYKSTKPKAFLKDLSISLALNLTLTAAIAWAMSISNLLILMLLFASLVATTANLDFMIRILSGKVLKSGSSIAHIGFALVLLGALLSTSQSETISQNTSLFDIEVLGETYDNNENILLMKDDTLRMGEYFVSYRGKEKEGHFIHYEVEYMQANEEGRLEKIFALYPFIQLNPRMGNVAEPYTKHYLGRDLYTHITYAELEEKKDESSQQEHVIQLGDTIFGKASFMVLDSLTTKPTKNTEGLTNKDMALGASFSLFDINTNEHHLMPLFVIRDRQYSFSVADSISSAGIKISFEGIDPTSESFKFVVEEQEANKKEFIVMKAIIFPAINVLWLGCILMAIGTFIAIAARLRRK